MTHKIVQQIAYHVFLWGRWIDTVYYRDDSGETTETVRTSLIKHDGYNPSIIVRRG